DRTNILCAKFNDESIAIFSGTSKNINVTNDLWIFNTLTSSWSLSNSIGAPSSRFGYYAICLPDETILYIGGIITSSQSENYLPMNNTTPTSGPTPPPRVFFSAVISMLFNM
ncbi:9102_t:CDS:2, partial [Scutellospora calospora]